MTKKDYEAFAKMLNEAYWAENENDDYADGWHDAIQHIRVRMCGVLLADNPRFDSATFISACLDVKS